MTTAHIWIIALAVGTVAAVLPATSWGCSGSYSSTTTIVATDAPDCLEFAGAQYSGFMLGASVRVTNQCGEAAIIDCTIPEGSGACGEALELAPGEEAAFSFSGRTISWYLTEEEQGEVEVDFDGGWSECEGCAMTGSPQGGSLPGGVLLLGVVLGVGVMRRRQPTSV